MLQDREFRLAGDDDAKDRITPLEQLGEILRFAVGFVPAAICQVHDRGSVLFARRKNIHRQRQVRLAAINHVVPLGDRNAPGRVFSPARLRDPQHSHQQHRNRKAMHGQSPRKKKGDHPAVGGCYTWSDPARSDVAAIRYPATT